MKFPSRRDAIIYTHFRGCESIGGLESVSFALSNVSFLKNFFYLHSACTVHVARLLARKMRLLSSFREDRDARSPETHAPFSHRGRKNQVSGNRRDLEKRLPMNRFAARRRWKRQNYRRTAGRRHWPWKTDVRLLLWRLPKFSTVQHFLSARVFWKKPDIKLNC